MYTVSTFYRFVALDELQSLQAKARKWMQELGVKGTILIAREGINSTVAGPAASIDELFRRLGAKFPELSDLADKRSTCEEMPFLRAKVKIKKEIVTFGQGLVDPNKDRGEYCPPSQWNSLISDPKTLVIDTRNDYEYRIGTFANAVNPETETFREFPEWVEENVKAGEYEQIAMFCTGGIRCEKATAWMRQRGFPKVYHLEGGILKYLEDVPQDDSL
ncbi:unnamed protein product, partial [Cyprideis torosa]